MKKEKARSFITLTDDILEPYVITMDENQYSLVKRGHTSPVGYYSTLGGALRKVARLQCIQEGEATTTIEGYLKTHASITDKLIERFSE